MKNLTSKVLATTLISVASLTAISSAALANGPQQGARSGGPGGPGGFPLIAMSCGENGADRLDNMLGRVAQRIDMTDAQSAAFDNFKAAALVAQTSFSEVCAANKPEADAERDLIDRLNTGQTIMAARLEAVGNVIPVFEVFYDSLSDDQKALLRPKGPGQRHGQRPGPQGQHGNGPNGNVNIHIQNGSDNS